MPSGSQGATGRQAAAGEQPLAEAGAPAGGLASRELGGRELSGRELSGRELGGRGTFGRGLVARDQPGRELSPPGAEQDTGPLADGLGQGPPGGAPTDPPGGSPGRRALKNWRVRSRLLLLIAIPTVTALVFGGFSIYSSVRSYQTYQRVEQLATLGKDVTVLAQALEDERDQTVFYISLNATDGGRAAGLSGRASIRANAVPQLTSLRQLYKVTNQAAAQVSGLAGQITSGFPAQTQQAATAVQQAVTSSALTSLRTASTKTLLPLLVVSQKYGQTINTVLAFNSNIGQGAGDPSLAQTVSVLGLVSAMQADASQQRAIVAAALNRGSFAPGELSALQDSVSSQQTSLQAFDAAATPAQLQLWNNAASRSDYDLSNSQEQQVLALANGSRSGQSLGNDPTTPDDWYTAMSNTIRNQMGRVGQQLVDSAISRAAALRKNAITTAAVVGAIALIVLALAMLFTIMVARSMVRPLRRLRADALSIAGVQLPGMVRRLSESEGTEGDIKIKPVDVDSTDEIGEVARAFDQVHAEAVRLASNEARLRGNVNAMFVNLSRRSQSLVERQIRLIDDLEQGEQDSERLGSLFRLDHLATRMRRNSENLLVLAGHEAARRWSQPVALVDVLRAAVSEIEHYERVVLNVQPGIAVRGQVVNDVVHLLAELIENATAFSSAQTQVNVSGHLLNSGGVLLDITDQGVGMAADEMAHANWRLDNPPTVDVSVSRRMGLFVVARLASRHGIRVRLRPAPAGGLTALIWLPDETVTHETGGTPSGLRRFEVDSPAVTDVAVDSFPGLGQSAAGGRSPAEAAVAAARAPRFTAPEPPDEELPKIPEQARGVEGDDEPEGGEAGKPPLPVRRGGPLPVRGGDGPGAEGTPGGDKPPSLPVWGNGSLPARGADALLGREAAQDDEEPAGADRLPRRDALHAGDGLSGGEALSDGFRLPRRDGLPRRDDQAEDDDGLPSGDGLPRRERPAAGPAEDEPNGLPSHGGSALPNRGIGSLWDAAEDSRAREDSEPEPEPVRDAVAPLSADVIVPEAPAGQDNRLPIFESVESDWFRQSRQSARGASQQDYPEIATGWSSPADEGWHAAETVESPTSGGLTAAGLPRRVPQANLVPGSVGDDEPGRVPSLVRSAAATRQRMASFQRGSRQGREALKSTDEPESGEDS
jgi:signal transduction histidine kinase